VVSVQIKLYSLSIVESDINNSCRFWRVNYRFATISNHTNLGRFFSRRSNRNSLASKRVYLYFWGHVLVIVIILKCNLGSTSKLINKFLWSVSFLNFIQEGFIFRVVKISKWSITDSEAISPNYNFACILGITFLFFLNGIFLCILHELLGVESVLWWLLSHRTCSLPIVVLLILL